MAPHKVSAQGYRLARVRRHHHKRVRSSIPTIRTRLSHINTSPVYNPHTPNSEMEVGEGASTQVIDSQTPLPGAGQNGSRASSSGRRKSKTAEAFSTPVTEKPKNKKSSTKSDGVIALTEGDDTHTGQSTLPLARVKKIIKLDEDVKACSNSASFAITIATV